MFEFLQAIADFFTVGIYDFFEEAAKYLISTLIIWWIKAQIAGLEFAWSVASSVLTGLNLSAQLSQAYALLPSEIVYGLNFFKVPQAINMLITAGMTRFVLNMIPGL